MKVTKVTSRGMLSQTETRAFRRFRKPGYISTQVSTYGKLPTLKRGECSSSSFWKSRGSTRTSPVGHRLSCNDCRRHPPPPDKVWNTASSGAFQGRATCKAERPRQDSLVALQRNLQVSDISISVYWCNLDQSRGQGSIHHSIE